MKYEFNNGSSVETIDNITGTVRGKNHWTIIYKDLLTEILNYINLEAEEAQEEHFSIPFETMADKFNMTVEEINNIKNEIITAISDSQTIGYADCRGNEFTFTINDWLLDNEPETKECYKCHETIDIDTEYCPYCGACVD